MKADPDPDETDPWTILGPPLPFWMAYVDPDLEALVTEALDNPNPDPLS